MPSHDNQGGPGPAPQTTTRSPVTINVVPLFQQGNVVACDLVSADMNGGNLKLDKKKAYTLQFNLQAGTPTGLQFRANKQDGSCDAFWSDPDDCPHNQTNVAGYAPSRTSGTQLTVNVDAPGQNACVYYRINFENGRYFDPVIVHQ